MDILMVPRTVNYSIYSSINYININLIILFYQ